MFESFGKFDPRWLDVPPHAFFIFHPWTCAAITTVLLVQNGSTGLYAGAVQYVLIQRPAVSIHSNMDSIS